MQTQTYGTKHCTHALSTFSQREALTEHVDSEDMLNECGGTRVSGTRVELWFDPSQWLGYEWASEDNPYSDDACAPAKPCSLHSPGPRHKCQGDSSAKRHRRTNEKLRKTTHTRWRERAQLPCPGVLSKKTLAQKRKTGRPNAFRNAAARLPVPVIRSFGTSSKGSAETSGRATPHPQWCMRGALITPSGSLDK